MGATRHANHEDRRDGVNPRVVLRPNQQCNARERVAEAAHTIFEREPRRFIVRVCAGLCWRVVHNLRPIARRIGTRSASCKGSTSTQLLSRQALPLLRSKQDMPSNRFNNETGPNNKTGPNPLVPTTGHHCRSYKRQALPSTIAGRGWLYTDDGFDPNFRRGGSRPFFTRPSGPRSHRA